MGLFSKHGGLSKATKTISKTVKTVSKGVDNIINNVIADTIKDPIGNIGKMVNDITGVTNSAKQQAEYNQQLQQQAMDFNNQQAQIERDWQENMSNTAQQRAVEDAKKAGINPNLMAGAGASSGGGAVASAPGGSTGAGTGTDPISTISELIKAVNNTAKTKAEVDNINADTKNKEQDYNLNEPDQETSKALKWWNSTWVGKGLNVAGQTIKQISPFIDTSTNISRANSARRISKSQRFK